MANVEFSFGGGKPGMPNLAGLKSRFLTIVAVVVVFIVLMAATTSIPTGHVGVLTLFGRVTGDVLPEGIHLINPLKSVEKMTVQTQSRKERERTVERGADAFVGHIAAIPAGPGQGGASASNDRRGLRGKDRGAGVAVGDSWNDRIAFRQ